MAAKHRLQIRGLVSTYHGHRSQWEVVVPTTLWIRGFPLTGRTHSTFSAEHCLNSDLETMLRSSGWAEVLQPAELDLVVQQTRERRVPAGAFLFARGDPADHWYGVIDGLLKMSLSRPDGRQSTFTGVHAGGWAGEGSLLKPGNWRYDAVATRETRVACVPRHVFQHLVSTSMPFNRFLLAHINARLSLFISLVEIDRLLGPTARVARCLASLFDPVLYPRQGRSVRLSQEEIGLLAAVSRQRTNQALHALERDGLLKVEFGCVTVHDLPSLRNYIDEAGSE
jgi:CRP/FNR family transcriptional regulator, cyclic AMP receptor protein